MMDSENASHSTLEAFEEQDAEESVDLDTGERPSREPPGQALAGLLKKLRTKTEDTPPQPAPPPQDTDGDGEPDATDDDDDGDGVVDQDDNAPRDFNRDGVDDTPAPARGPVDLRGIPPTPADPSITAAAADYRDSQAPTISDGGHRPRERDIISTGNNFSNQQPAPRRGGRGKAERRRQMRFNSGTRGYRGT